MSSRLIRVDLDARRALMRDIVELARDDSGLVALADSLRAEIAPLLGTSGFRRALPIPDVKARLTRKGGRCPIHGTLLEFDPWSPHEHRCRHCACVYTDFEHHEWWAMGAQLWVAERAVQAATLAVLRDDADAEALSLRILSELTARYTSWPNSDNALGPTRPFFSTYLESIWLLNICHAIALLEQPLARANTERGVRHGDGNRNRSFVRMDASERARVLGDVREQLVRPSRDLVASFPEGLSNRQVWNEVAVLSASKILGDDSIIARRLESGGGLLDLFEHGLLADGTWYEGENYHLFAHRGLWYGSQLLDALGRPLPTLLAQRFEQGFTTPFFGLLPDDTIPSRRDSQYHVSVRQWRFAEWCELGIVAARASVVGQATEAPLAALLGRLYHPDSGSSDLTAQHRHAVSTADAERNEPPGPLTRADLSWRSLLLAEEVVPVARGWRQGSACLPNQGLAVIRRDQGRVYVALEGGHTGGGHGHPDRLALTLQHEQSRWTEDPGTGSYVEQALHWYRSTLAHAAPLIDGASQDAVSATLLAFEDRGGAGWMCKRVEDMKPGVHVQRTLVVCDGYLLDVVEWGADRVVQFDLPVTRNAGLVSARGWKSASPGGAGGLEDGFDFLADVHVAERTAPVARASDVVASGVAANDTLASDASADVADVDAARSMLVFTVGDDPNVVAQYFGNATVDVWRATAPGAPGRKPAPLYWLRAHAQRGWMIGVWSWTGCTWSVIDVGGTPSPIVPSPIVPSPIVPLPIVRVFTPDGTEAVHTRNALGWHIALAAGGAASSIQLQSRLPAAVVAAYSIVCEPDVQADSEAVASTHTTLPPAAAHVHQLLDAAPGLFFALGQSHYRRTEQNWDEAGQPAASINIEVKNGVLDIGIIANTGPIVVPQTNEPNTLDNERPDVNADGIELFLAQQPGEPWKSSWLIVPAGDDIHARVTPTIAGSPDIVCVWAALAIGDREGWAMRLQVLVSAIPQQPDGTFAMEIIVNERPARRQRRRGQLVLSGGGGFAYLRGDRSDSALAHRFRLPQ